MYISKRQSFLQAAVILSLSMIMVKIMGAMFKIPLISIINENGMGYYNTAFSLYSVFYSLSTAGFPTAISRLVSENLAKGNYTNILKIKKISLPIFVLLGIISSLIMLIIAKPYTNFIGNSLAYLPIIALTPSIFFCSVISVYKGYYQGLSNMYPTAFCEIIEALIKLVLGLSFSYFTVKYLNSQFELNNTVLGISYADSHAYLVIYSLSATSALVAVSLGSFFSLIYILIYNKFNKVSFVGNKLYSKPNTTKTLFIKLLRTALPVGIGSLSISFCMLLDSAILQKILYDLTQKFPNELLSLYGKYLPTENLDNINSLPNYLYGCYSFSLTLFMLVPTIAQAFATSAVPSLASVWSLKSNKAIKLNIETILRLTCIVSIPAGLGLTAVARPIVSVLNGSNGSSQIMSKILIILGFAAVFSAVSIPINAMLQAVGKAKIATINLSMGLFLKVVLSYFLCQIVSINIFGACISTLGCYLYVSLANLICLVRFSPVKLDLITSVYKPLIVSIFSIITTFFISYYMMTVNFDMKLNVIISVGFAVVFYSILLLLTKTIKDSDINMIKNKLN
ncbi:MAG: polysaccharide biosynthesis C-terminal domain-containing protein [Clostridia bacterium]